MSKLRHFTGKIIYFLVVGCAIAVSCKDDDDKPITPQVIAVTPEAALPNELAIISGQFFSLSPENNKVLFNGVSALILSTTQTSLTVLVPANATTGAVTVTSNNLEASNKPIFTVLVPSSSVTNVSPTTGGYGTLVTITGKDFRQPASSNIITFNGVPAVVQSATVESITVKVPIRAGTGLLVVNGVSSGVNFSYQADVFIAGWEANAKGEAVAKLWKNGVPLILADRAVPSDMLLLNEDVYVVGTTYGSTAVLWKNGIEVPLTLGPRLSTATSITAVGEDIYIGGYEVVSAGHYNLIYWKNGTPVSLLEIEGTLTSVKGIFVNGTEVTMYGTVDGYATYWNSSGSTRISSAFSSFFGGQAHGQDIYYCGYDAWKPSGAKATYWENGVPVYLTTGATFGVVYSVKVTDTGIHAVGWELNSKNVQSAKYWKNGIPTIISDGSDYVGVAGIDVVGDDVFILGFGSGTLLTIKYWKNGVPHTITDGSYQINPVAIKAR